MLSNFTDVHLCVWTCSYPKEIGEYLKMFRKEEINFDSINNTKVENNNYGFFEDKPYSSLILDDKGGFDADHDWKHLFDYINSIKKSETILFYDRL